MDLPRLCPWAAPNGRDYWGRPWAYLNLPSGHVDVGVSSRLTPPSSQVTVAVLVDCLHETQFLPNMDVAQLTSMVAGRVSHQSRPLIQSGANKGTQPLEVTAKRMLPRGYGASYSAVILDQPKAWKSFQVPGVGHRETHTPMPSGDVTAADCPQAGFCDQEPRSFPGRKCHQC